jgi:MFS family permease
MGTCTRIKEVQSTKVYIGFCIIFARLSDGIGRKEATILAWILFSGFSFASGLAQSMNQLIIFRAMQGIGGSGLYSMTTIVLPQISPVRLWGIVSGLIGMCSACSSIIGTSNGNSPRSL